MGKTAYKRFIDIYSEFTKEYEDYYSQYPIPVAQVEARIEQLDQAHPGATSYERKAFIYQAAACTQWRYGGFPARAGDWRLADAQEFPEGERIF